MSGVRANVEASTLHAIEQEERPERSDHARTLASVRMPPYAPVTGPGTIRRLLEAFRSACGEIAPGLDPIVMLVAGIENIRDVIAPPRRSQCSI